MALIFLSFPPFLYAIAASLLDSWLTLEEHFCISNVHTYSPFTPQRKIITFSLFFPHCSLGPSIPPHQSPLIITALLILFFFVIFSSYFFCGKSPPVHPVHLEAVVVPPVALVVVAAAAVAGLVYAGEGGAGAGGAVAAWGLERKGKKYSLKMTFLHKYCSNVYSICGIARKQFLKNSVVQ